MQGFPIQRDFEYCKLPNLDAIKAVHFERRVRRVSKSVGTYRASMKHENAQKANIAIGLCRHPSTARHCGTIHRPHLASLAAGGAPSTRN